jgi:RNA polymerase sigma-70 factor (ECF subfamily)
MQTAHAPSQKGNNIRSPAESNFADQALIEAIADGDKHAMRALFLRHSVKIYRYILRITRRQSLAEELLNEVFLAVWQQSDKFDGRSQVITWLLGIARLKAINAMRQRPHKGLTEEAMAQVADPPDNPEALLERNDRCSRLRTCLTRLSPMHREIIDLVYYHGRPVAEVAEILGIPPGWVKMRMFDARGELADLLQEVG